MRPVRASLPSGVARTRDERAHARKGYRRG